MDKESVKDGAKVVVEIPEDAFIALDYTIEGHPTIGIINVGLKNLKRKDIFGWNLSLIFDLEDIGKNGIPSGEELGIIQDYCESLERKFNDAIGKTNALFLFRETYDGISHVTWRVYDAESADFILQEEILRKTHPREFEYRMEYDEDWQLVEWYMQDFDNTTNDYEHGQ